MADPATNTAYPAAIETFPEINSGARMIDLDVRHDQVHDRAHATLNALQALVGVTDFLAQDPESVLGRLGRLRDGGILVQCGSKELDAAPLPIGFEASGIAPSSYVLTGWQMWCYPLGTIQTDVRRSSFAALPPGAGASITGASSPVISTNISAEAVVDPEDWSPMISAGDAVTVTVVDNTFVKWFALLLKGYRA